MIVVDRRYAPVFISLSQLLIHRPSVIVSNDYEVELGIIDPFESIRFFEFGISKQKPTGFNSAVVTSSDRSPSAYCTAYNASDHARELRKMLSERFLYTFVLKSLCIYS